MNLDFGSGYNPKEGYKTCDFTFGSNLDFCYDSNINKIISSDGNVCKKLLFKNINCRNVLHHIKNIKLTINELYRVLKIGGKLTIIEPRKEYFKQNIFLDKLWYCSINKREDIWISEEYREYDNILKNKFKKINITYNEEKQTIICIK
jgi:SAM-dependent methyltransferase